MFTTVSELNFAQLAVRACQRAQGDKNKAMREAWVRLCGTYQSKGGPIAHREVRKVRPLALAYLFQCPRSGAHSVLWSDVSTPLIPYPSSAGFVRIAQPQQCYKRSPRCPSSPLDWPSLGFIGAHDGFVVFPDECEGTFSTSPLTQNILWPRCDLRRPLVPGDVRVLCSPGPRTHARFFRAFFLGD